MPVPTDTLWNVRRLNIVFAVSSVLLVLVTLWTIIQDYDQDWRRPQQQGRVWEAALVDEKISREMTPEVKAKIAELDKQIAEKDAQIKKAGGRYAELNKAIIDTDSKRANIEFGFNNLKSVASVSESQLQDAVTAKDTKKARELEQSLVAPRAEIARQAEEIFRLNTEREKDKKELEALQVEVTALKKAKTELESAADSLRKKKAALQPQGLLAHLSQEIRSAPLMQFINPSERVQQIVMPDVQTDMQFEKKVSTTDRCMTCHVNIQKKDFTRENIQVYLEEQVASARGLNLPAKATGKPTDPSATRTNPGAAALPEFWHGWAARISPAALAKNKFRATSLAATVAKDKAMVWYDGQALDTFKYDPALTGEASAKQDAILVELIKAWSKYDKPVSPDATIAGESSTGKVKVQISAKMDAKAATTAQNIALMYSEVLQKALKDTIPANAYTQLEDRYRYALVDTINPYRKKEGLKALDATPVLLAHPKLNLYVDIDSKHSFETMGCTSCHDGSGQETHFVLAAHTPKPIWVDDKTGQPVLSSQFTHPHKEEEHATLTSLLDTIYPEDEQVPSKASAFHLTTGHGAAAAHDEHGEHKAPAATQASTQKTETSTATATTAGPAADEIASPPGHGATTMEYVDPATGKSGKAVPQMDHWIHKYEPTAPRTFALVYHEWDRPMLTAKYLQANCVRCHNDPHEIQDEAPIIHEGRQLFNQMGCVNCHQMDSIPATQQRKVGTDLRQVTAKLSPAFINTWVWAPKAFRPSTRMPHFFMLENNSSDEELRRTRQEARAITEYLVQTATPQPVKHSLSKDAKGDKANGKKLFAAIGCMGCHTNLNDSGEEWITTDLVKRGAMKSDEAKKAYAAMSYNDRQLYAMRYFPVPETDAPLPTYADKTLRPIFMHLGPELSAIGTKLTADRSEADAKQWLYQWLKEPRHYSEYTIMPSLRLTDQEAIDLMDYLLDQKRTSQRPDDKWTAGVTPSDPEKLSELTALFLRSKYSIETSKKKAVDAAELNTLAKDALTTQFVGAIEADAKAKAMNTEQKQLVFLGKKLISHYGCMQCHAINGMETASSPCANLSDWGQKGVDKLAFEYIDHHKIEHLPKTSAIPMVNGLSVEAANLGHTMPEKGWNAEIAKPVDVGWPEVDHNRVSWITQKLKNTRVYDRGKVLQEPVRKTENGKTVVADPGKPYDKLKMPTFYLEDREVDAIVTFVISNRDRLITERMIARTNTQQAQQIAYGRYLTEKYNCVSCHQTEHNVPPIQRFFKSDEITKTAPPSLRGEGNKIQHAWLYNFLKHVEPLRPLPVIRMPSFPMTDSEATAIAAYFSAVSNKESNELQKTIDPVYKYTLAQMKAAAAKTPSTQPAATNVTHAASVVPESDWWTLPQFSRQTAELVDWGLTNGKIKAGEIDPTKNTSAELAKGYRTLLFRAMFTQGLYHAEYPFVDSPRPEISDQRFKLGEQFLYDLQCLKCHVMGDPKAPGARTDATAPNLSLTARRLQRRWVRHWVQEPPIIQTGTAMPAFFTGEPIFKLDGQTQPRAQNVPEPERSRIENTYGKTVDEETNLLLDFLYAAGVRGYTAVQPAGPAPATAPAPVAKEAAPAPAPVAKEPAPAVKEAAPAPTPAPPPEAKPQAAAPAPAPAPAPQVAIATPPPTPAAPKTEAGGSGIVGKVKFAGTPPKASPLKEILAVPQCAQYHPDGPPAEETLVVNDNGTLKNVVVSISAGLPEGAEYPVPKTPVVIDQQGCTYHPHVVAMMTRQVLNVKNSDDFLHNVHSLSQENPSFNQAQSIKDEKGFDITNIKFPESIHLTCDVHKWMNAYINVFDHPFFAVTGDDGSFSIPNLPPGTYTIRAWHEKLPVQEQEIKVEAGKPTTIDFAFKE